MTEETDATATTARRPRVLWANRYCLLDTASGASMAVREILHRLAARGVEVRILGATVFDAEGGGAAIRERLETSMKPGARMAAVQDGALTHRLVRTASWRGTDMTLDEITTWMSAYRKDLETDPPDLVMFYGGRPPDWLIPGEARHLGIPSAAYLGNGSYNDTRWCRDVDLILTDTQATADLYRDRLGLSLQPVGPFIDTGRVLSASHARSHVTFVSPTLAKGAALVAQLALFLEEKRPDIRFEVVEGRGVWADVLRRTSAALGEERTELANVTVTPNTRDMRPVYGRARILLAPSLWWESAGRVAVEAMFNGIPVIATNRGGLPEMVGPGGYLIDIPEPFFEKPYSRLLPPPGLERIAGLVESLHDDEDTYRQLSARAAAHARETHRIERSTERLCAALRPYLGDLAAAA